MDAPNDLMTKATLPFLDTMWPVHDGINPIIPSQGYLTPELQRRQALFDKWDSLTEGQKFLIQRLHMACWIKTEMPDLPLELHIPPREVGFFRDMADEGLIKWHNGKARTLWTNFNPVDVSIDASRTLDKPRRPIEASI